MNWFSKKSSRSSNWYVADVIQDISKEGDREYPKLNLESGDVVAFQRQGDYWVISPIAHIYYPTDGEYEEFKSTLEKMYQDGEIDENYYQKTMLKIQDKGYEESFKKPVIRTHKNFMQDYRNSKYFLTDEEARQVLKARRDKEGNPLSYDNPSYLQASIFYQPLSDASKKNIRKHFDNLIQTIAKNNQLEPDDIESMFYDLINSQNFDDFVEQENKRASGNSWARSQGIHTSILQYAKSRLNNAAEKLKEQENRSNEQIRRREFEEKAKSLGMIRCPRCGGAGGFKHWPGFTCFECEGSGMIEPRNKSEAESYGISWND